jgi:YD repeat-containing protein
MTTAVNNNSDQRYYYDELSRLIKMEEYNPESDSKEYTVEYQYNELGQRKKVTVSEDILDERIINYQYDELMRLKKVELPDEREVTYQYDKLNRVIQQINGNRTGTSYSYTPDGQVESITHWKGLRGFKEQIIQSFGYLYNARDQKILQLEGNGQIEAYQYDPVGRLTKVFYPYPDRKKVEDLKERFYYRLLPEFEKGRKFRFKLPHHLDWQQQKELREQFEESLDNYREGFEQNNKMPNSPGQHMKHNRKQSFKGHGDYSGKDRKTHHRRPEELIIKPDTNCIPFIDNIDFSFEVRDRMEDIYQEIKQGNRGIGYHGRNFWVEEFNYDPAGNVTQKSNG